MSAHPKDDGWPIPWEPVAGNRTGPLAWLEYVVAEGTLRALAKLPRGAQDALIEVLARIARRVDARHTRAARDFITQALGPEISDVERERLVLQSWRYFLTLLLRNVGFDANVPQDQRRSHYELDLCPAARDVLENQRVCVMVTPHLGDFEASAALMPALGYRAFYAVARPPRNRRLSLSIQRLRERRGFRVIHRRGAMAVIPKIVEGGGSVGLLLDQRPHGKAVIAPFFGRPARCERGAGVLLRRLKVPVLIASCYTTDVPYRYRIFIPTVLQPDDFARATPEEIATRINAETERLILRHPEQYFWLHDRFG